MSGKWKTYAETSKALDKVWFKEELVNDRKSTAAKELKWEDLWAAEDQTEKKKNAASAIPDPNRFSDIFKHFNGRSSQYQDTPVGLSSRLEKGSPSSKKLQADLTRERVGLKGCRSMASIVGEDDGIRKEIPSELINHISDTSSDLENDYTRFEVDLRRFPGYMDLSKIDVPRSPSNKDSEGFPYKEDSIFYKTYMSVQKRQAKREKAESSPQAMAKARQDKAFDLFSIHTGAKEKPNRNKKASPKAKAKKSGEKMNNTVYVADSFGGADANDSTTNRHTEVQPGKGNLLPVRKRSSLDLQKYRLGSPEAKGKSYAKNQDEFPPWMAHPKVVDSRDASASDSSSESSEPESEHSNRMITLRNGTKVEIHRPIIDYTSTPIPNFSGPTLRPPNLRRKKKLTKKQREEEAFLIYTAGMSDPEGERDMFELDKAMKRVIIRQIRARKRRDAVNAFREELNMGPPPPRPPRDYNKIPAEELSAIMQNYHTHPFFKGRTGPVPQDSFEKLQWKPKPKKEVPEVAKTTALASVRFATDKKNVEKHREKELERFRRLSSYVKEPTPSTRLSMSARTPRVIKKDPNPFVPRPATQETRTGTLGYYKTQLTIGGIDTAGQMTSKKKVEQWLGPLNAGMYHGKTLSQDNLVYLGKNVREAQTAGTATGKKTTAPGDWGVIGRLNMASTLPNKARKPLGAP